MINGMHVDKEFLNIVDMFRNKKPELVDDGVRIRILENVYSRFNLQSESLLMNRIKVDYRKIINTVCSLLPGSSKDLDSLEYPSKVDDGSGYEVKAYIYVIGKFIVLCKSYLGKIDFEISVDHSKIDNLGNWFFGASVICNAIASSMKMKADDITFLYKTISILEKDCDKFFEMKNHGMMAEIPQLTLSERTWGLPLGEFKPDDFEIWNYYWDSYDK